MGLSGCISFLMQGIQYFMNNHKIGIFYTKYIKSILFLLKKKKDKYPGFQKPSNWLSFFKKWPLAIEENKIFFYFKIFQYTLTTNKIMLK